VTNKHKGYIKEWEAARRAMRHVKPLSKMTKEEFRKKFPVDRQNIPPGRVEELRKLMNQRTD